MKQLKCEMCGGTDLIKEDGVFVCQACGVKYSVEEAKRMMVEFDGPVNVVVNKEKQTANALKLADDNFDSANYEQAQKYYTMVLEEDYNNAYATYMVGLCSAYRSTLAHLNAQALNQAMINAKKVLCSQNATAEEIDKFCILMLIKTNSFYLAFRTLAIQHYNEYNTLKSSAIDYYNHQTNLLSLQRTAIELLDESCLQDIKNEVNIKTAINNTFSSINEITRTFHYKDGIEQKGRDIYGNPMYQDKYYSITATDKQLYFAGECQGYFEQILKNLPTETKKRQERQAFFAEKKQFEKHLKSRLNNKKNERDELNSKGLTGIEIFLIFASIVGGLGVGGALDSPGIGVLVFIVIFVICIIIGVTRMSKVDEKTAPLNKEIEMLENILKEPNKYKKEIEKLENDFKNEAF